MTGWIARHNPLSLSRYDVFWLRLFLGRRHLAQRLIRRADRARDAGDYSAAAARYRRALALDHSRVDIRVQLAHMLKELTQYGQAEAAYRQALAQSPEDGDIHLQLGHLLKLLGRTEEAAAAYAAAHLLLQDSEGVAAELRALGAPSDAGVSGADIRSSAEHIGNGDRLRDARRYAEAAKAYGSAVRLAPARTDIRIQYGNMLKDCGRLADAEMAYRAALAQAPGDAEIYLQLGHLFKLQGRHDEAVAAYRRSAEIAPSGGAALQELFHAGFEPAQQRQFDAQIAHGGVEAFLALTDEVAHLRAAVARLAEALPDINAQIAFPVASYDRYRNVYDIPAPPPATDDPKFGIVLAVSDVTLLGLYDQIAGLSAQTYRNWQLCVVGTDAALRRVVERAAASDRRIGWIEAAADEEASVAERRIALALAADWIVLPARGALLHCRALAWFAAAVAIGVGDGAALAFVTDEEQVSEEGGAPRRSAPQLRQAVDYDTLLETNPFGETVVVERSAYAAIAGSLIAGSLCAARSSLLLALAERGTVGHIPLPLVAIAAPADQDRQPPTDPCAAHAAAVRAHLATAGLAERVTVGLPVDPASPLAISWQPRDPDQPVQVIIPTRDNAGDIRDFVASLRDHAASPGALRVLIVDNGSRATETARILAELTAQKGVQVVAIDEPFNWSRLNNRAVALTDPELLVFANDDMLMLSDCWDRQLRGLLERPEIGAVGARLLYPDDTVQHAGILLGWPGIEVHDGRHEPVSRAGPGSRWHVSRAASAVTGAFLAVRREAFESSGGFDEIGLPVAYGDIDFALKLRARGRKILWTPSITLRHYESKTRGLDHLDAEKRARNAAERKVMEQRWGVALAADPSVNPAWHNATLPFRLIAAPPQSRLWRHIRVCASANPWVPECRLEQDAGVSPGNHY